jgi:tripeptidyl-peptidase-1
MKLFVACLAIFGACAASAFVLSSNNLEHTTFAVVGAADMATTLKVTMSLTKSNDATMTKLFNEVSDPKSARYGQFLSTEEVQAMTRPSKESVKAVESFLLEHDVEFTTSPMGHTITLEPTVAQASKMFGANFSLVVSESTKQTATVGDKVTLPASLSAHVEAVYGVHGLPLPPRKNVRLSAGTPADVTPAVLKSTYNIGGVTVSRGTKNRIGVLEFQGQLMSQKDLTTFFTKYVPNAQSGDDQVYKYVSDQSQGEGVEANLDVQYVMGVATGVKTEMWQYANSDFCGDLKTWTSGALNTTNPPTVFTVSYGWQGDMSQLGCSTAQIAAIDADFKSMSVAGMTIIFASGDSGSGSTGGIFSATKLYASWPASSLYVTAVGATRFQNQQVGQPEQASDQFGSGGGFSRLVTQPTWQNAAVTSFYAAETKAPPASVYGKGGRGTPDVAALGEGFQVIMNGNPEAVGGTSASAPSFAGMVALLNEARFAAGKSALGNLNAWIYQNNGAMFTDITVGSDRISRQGSAVTDGFDCVKGWDPVTGFGTPNFPAMLKAALAA